MPSKKQTGITDKPKGLNLYGYMNRTNPKTGMYEVIPEEKKIIETIFNYFIDMKCPANAIKDKLNLEYPHSTRMGLRGNDKARFTTMFIISVLNRPEYCGFEKRKNNELFPSMKYDPIILYERFMEAKKLLQIRKKRKMNGSEYQKNNPFSGLLYCMTCKKRFYIRTYKTGIKYYVHTHQKESFCEKGAYKQNTIDKLLYAFIFHTLTHRKSLSMLFLYFFMKDSGFHPYSKYNLRYRVLDLKNIILDLYPRYADSNKNKQQEFKITEKVFWQIIKSITIKLRKNKDAFFIFIKENIEILFLKKALDLDFILYIIVGILIKGTIIHVHSYGSYINRISIAKPSKQWKDQIDILYPKDAKLEQNKKAKLKELLKKIEEICTQSSYSQMKDLYSQVHQRIKLNIAIISNPALDSFRFISMSDYADVELSFNQNKEILIIQDIQTKKYYIQKNDEKEEIEVLPIFDSILSYIQRERIYFNTAYLHNLPEWLYGYNYEYFQIGKKKVCFIEEDNKIKAFMLSYKGKRTEIPFDAAIAMIRECKDAKYVELD